MKTVLIVDDEEDVRESIMVALGELNDVEIEMAANGIEALEIVGKKKIDAQVVDIEMPKMGGIEYLKVLENGRKDIPTVVITGYICKVMKYDVINKPYRPSLLLETVERLLKS